MEIQSGMKNALGGFCHLNSAVCMQSPALATCAPGEQKLSSVPNRRHSVLYKIHLDTQNIHTGLANAVQDLYDALLPGPAGSPKRSCMSHVGLDFCASKLSHGQYSHWKCVCKGRFSPTKDEYAPSSNADTHTTDVCVQATE